MSPDCVFDVSLAPETGRDSFIDSTGAMSQVPGESPNRESCIGKHLVWSVRFCRLPQFDGISLRIVHAGKPAGGIGWVHLDLDSRSL
jgi:hypothetical protein